MQHRYIDILNKIPKHMEEIETILECILQKGDVDYLIHTIDGFSRIEFISNNYFSCSGYMETTVLYYCAYAYFDLMVRDMDEHSNIFGYKEQYEGNPLKEFADGIDIMFNIVMQSEDVNG